MAGTIEQTPNHGIMSGKTMRENNGQQIKFVGPRVVCRPVGFRAKFGTAFVYGQHTS